MTPGAAVRLVKPALLPGLGWLSLIAGAFFLPFVRLVPGRDDLFPGLYLWDWQRAFQGASIGLGCAVVVVNAMAGRLRLPFLHLSLWFWGGIAALTLGSALTALHPSAALLDWAWMHALAVMTLLSAWLFMRSDGGVREDYCLAPAGIAVLLYTFWFFITNSDILFSYDFQSVETVFPGFSNSRYFSDFQSPLLFLAPLAVNRYLLARRERVLGWLIVGLFYMLAFVAGSRSTLAGQAAAHVLLFLALGKGYIRHFRTYLFCWVLGFALYILIIVVVAPWSASIGAPAKDKPAPSVGSGSVLTTPFRYGSSGRGELVEKSFRLISSAPWLGVGGRHYGCFLKGDFQDTYNRFNGDAAHPHNAILQLAVEWGLPVAMVAATAIAWLLVLVARKLRIRRVEKESLLPAMFGGLVALLVHAMVTGVLNGPASQMFLVMLIGWSLSLIHEEEAVPECVGGSVAISFAAIGLAMCIASLLSQELMALPASNRAYSDENPPTWYLAPRFWQQGWLLPLCGKI